MLLGHHGTESKTRVAGLPTRRKDRAT